MEWLLVNCFIQNHIHFTCCVVSCGKSMIILTVSRTRLLIKFSVNVNEAKPRRSWRKIICWRVIGCCTPGHYISPHLDGEDTTCLLQVPVCTRGSSCTSTSQRLSKYRYYQRLSKYRNVPEALQVPERTRGSPSTGTSQVKRCTQSDNVSAEYVYELWRNCV